MEGGSDVTISIIDELHSWDIEGVPIEGESGVTRSVIDELCYSEIRGDLMEA